jgi:chaperonin GroEL|tara:strand:+ start:991 stop:2556 length:1566 start_codon:yes stop_codon:yes gene_type:complete
MKNYDDGSSLSQKILDGVNKLADNVAATMGPRGRNVVIHPKNGNPVITKDGVTVARFIDFTDPFENVGAQIIKQASEETNASAGDGTTTAIVLSRSIFVEAQKYIAAGASPVELKRGIDKATAVIVNNLQASAKRVTKLDDIEDIATISANGDRTIGKLISTAIDMIGKDGSITIEDGKSLETSLDVVEGFRFDSGYAASAFITDERRGVLKYNDPLFLITDEKIEFVEDILPALELAARDGRPIIVVAEEIEGQALAAMIMNTVRGTMKVAAIKAPRYGEERRSILQDLATSVGATFVTRESGLSIRDIKLTHLGNAKTIEASKVTTTIVGGHGSSTQVEQRIDSLKSLFEQTDSLQACERIQERITRLASGIAIISVGGNTEIEMTEKKHRIEDALEAVKSAQQEGMVCGGGMALLSAGRGVEIQAENSDQEYGAQIVLKAIQEPLRQMAANAGKKPDVMLDSALGLDEGYGFDMSTGKTVDLLDSGIIDPAKVTRCALQNAVSAIGTLITTSHAIIED